MKCQRLEFGKARREQPLKKALKSLFLNCSGGWLVGRAEVLWGSQGPRDLQCHRMRNSPTLSPPICASDTQPGAKTERNSKSRPSTDHSEPPNPNTSSGLASDFLFQNAAFPLLFMGTPQSPTKINNSSRRIPLSVPGSFRKQYN